MATNQAKIEALLFVSGDDGITVTELAQLVGILKPAVLEQLTRLEQKYAADRNGSFTLIHADERYRLVTKPGVAGVVRRYFEAPAMATPFAGRPRNPGNYCVPPARYAGRD